MHDPVAMEIDKALQELVQNRLDSSRRYGLALRLVVVVDDLEQVVLCILEDDEDALVF